jgi:hypothetical protein
VSLVKTVTLQITGEIRDAAAKIGLISKDAQDLADKSPVELKAELAGTEMVRAKLGYIEARAEELKKNFPEFTAKIDIGVASAKMAVLRREIRGTAKAAAEAGSSGGGFGIFRRAIAGITGAISGGGGGAGLIGSIGSLIGGAGAGIGLAGLVAIAGQVTGALAAATLGLGAFGAVAIPILSNLKTQLATVSTANDNFAAAAENVNTAIHVSSLDMKLYRDALKGLPAGLQAAIRLLGDTGVTWQNLSRAQRDNVIAVSQNKDIIKTLLPAQKTSLAALLASKAAWEELTPAQRKAARSLHSISDAWGRLTKALEPDVLKIFDQGLKIAVRLLPDFLPLAKSAAGAIGGLLKNFSDFVGPAQSAVKPMGQMSESTARMVGAASGQKGSQFRDFLTQMKAISGPAITALGQGFGKIAIAIGKFLQGAAKPDSVRALNRLLGFTADVIGALSWIILRGIGNWQKWIDILHQTASKFDEFRHDFAIGAHEIAVHFDGMRHAAADWAHNLAMWFDEVRHNIATWAHDVAATFDQWRHDTAQKVDAVVSFFIRLPGRIGHALSGLGSLLFNIGKHAIQSLINGLLSLWHKLMSLLGRVRGILGLGGGGGDKGGSAGANMVIARRMMPAWSTGSQWASWVQLNNRESGWNRFAENRSSGAYGIPQALPPTKMPFAAQKAGGSSASAQLGWQIGYIGQRYGTPAGAWAHELTHGWYDSGTQYLPPGPSIAWNMTGRPERVGGEDLGPLLRKLIKQNARLIALTETAPAAYAQGTTRALNGMRIPVTRPRGG